MKVPFESFESPAIERMRSLTICPLRRFVFSLEAETSFSVFSSYFEKSESFRNYGRALSSAGLAGDAFEREKRGAGFGFQRFLPVRIESGFFRNTSFSTSRRFVRRLSVGLRPPPSTRRVRSGLFFRRLSGFFSPRSRPHMKSRFRSTYFYMSIRRYWTQHVAIRLRDSTNCGIIGLKIRKDPVFFVRRR